MNNRRLIRLLDEQYPLAGPSTSLRVVYPQLVEGLRVNGPLPLVLSVAATAAESKHAEWIDILLRPRLCLGWQEGTGEDWESRVMAVSCPQKIRQNWDIVSAEVRVQEAVLFIPLTLALSHLGEGICI